MRRCWRWGWTGEPGASAAGGRLRIHLADLGLHVPGHRVGREDGAAVSAGGAAIAGGGHHPAGVGAGALYFLLGHGGLFWAEQRVASGVAALMIATEHFWVVLIAWALPGGTAPSRRAAVGVLIGLAGVAMLTLTGGAEGGLDPLGMVVLLGASGAWAAGSIYFQGPRRPHSGAYAAGMPLLMGGILLLIASAASGETARVRAEDFTPVAIGSLLYLIVFGSVIAFSAFTWLVETEGASRASSYAYINPFVAVLLGWGVAGEALTPRMLGAGAAIVLAVVLIVRGTPSEARQPVPAASPVRARPRRLTEREA